MLCAGAVRRWRLRSSWQVIRTSCKIPRAHHVLHPWPAQLRSLGQSLVRAARTQGPEAPPHPATVVNTSIINNSSIINASDADLSHTKAGGQRLLRKKAHTQVFHECSTIVVIIISVPAGCFSAASVLPKRTSGNTPSATCLELGSLVGFSPLLK